MTGNLTKKQRKFLCHFAKSGNLGEAAAACGIPPDSAYEEGIRILRHPLALSFVTDAALTMKRFGDGVEDGLNRLIDGRINDAVILARNGEELSDDEVRRLDLYNVSEMKFGKGVCEIKFADRLKAIEKLNEIRSGRATDSVAQSFFDAIGKAAEENSDHALSEPESAEA